MARNYTYFELIEFINQYYKNKSMKKTYAFLVTLFCLFSITLISGCKKDDNNSSTCSNGVKDGDETGVDCGGSCTACIVTGGTAKIKTHTHPGRFAMITDTYVYDSMGRAVSITSSDDTETYSYSGNTITHVFFGYTTNSKVNTQGYIDSTAGQSGTYDVFYTYDSEGHLLSTSNVSYNHTYTWSGDNMTGSSVFGTNDTYTYLSGTNTIGNANKGEAFLGKDSKNLVATKVSSGSSYTYSYTYDSQNRVASMSDGNITESFTYY
jgi:hypothetical protein